MPAKNIECQLAQGQIGRYLAGVNMSAEAIAQLEQHIAECDDCSQYVDAKRNTLQEVARTRQAAVSMTAPEREPQPESAPAAPSPAPSRSLMGGALIQAIREKSNPLAHAAVLETVREPQAPRRTYWRTLAYAGGLGAVLLAMSHLAANPTALFGDRVGAGVATPTEAKSSKLTPAASPGRDPFDASIPAAKPESTPEKNPPASSDSANSNDVTKPAETSSAPKPKPAVPANPLNASPSPSSNSISSSTPPSPTVTATSRRVPRTPRRTIRRPASKPRAGNSVRVYDPNGQPIK